MVTYMRSKPQKRETYEYTDLTRFALQQELRPHCKATTLQLKKENYVRKESEKGWAYVCVELNRFAEHLKRTHRKSAILQYKMKLK